jgi:hypothetical protein
MGTSNLVTQQGDSTFTWSTTGGSLDTHDAIVPKLEDATTNSGIRFSDITLSIGPVKYTYTVTAVGPGVISFRTNNESIG